MRIMSTNIDCLYVKFVLHDLKISLCRYVFISFANKGSHITFVVHS